MGDVIYLSERRAIHPPSLAPARPAFFFDLSCPFSYLAAERIERVLGDAQWIPAAGSLLRQGPEWASAGAARAHAETCGVVLRIPLVWPDRFPVDTPAALRAAAYAAEVGAGARFALAASRLAFCGGFDLEDPEILAEAAAAAGIGLLDCLSAAGDLTRDEQLVATARGLIAQGATRLPVISIGSNWFDGDGALAAAAALVRSPTLSDGSLVG